MDRAVSNRVQALLEANTRTATVNGQALRFSVPSPKTYPFQWFWDSCFHSIVWTHFDVERAKEELRALVSSQDRDGFIPHIIYWDKSRVSRSVFLGPWQESKGWWSFLPFTPKPRHSALMQPPVIAQAVERVWEKSRDREFLADMLPRLNRYYAWLKDFRDPDRDRLISIVCPYESGIDSSPAYDDVIGFKPRHSPASLWLRTRRIEAQNKFLFSNHKKLVVRSGRFHVEDVLVNSIYALNLDVLARLNRTAGEGVAAGEFEDESRLVTEALETKCWNKGRHAFFNLDTRAERRNDVLTVISLMPIILPWLNWLKVRALVEEHLLNTNEFWLRYPVPSVAANEPTYSPAGQTDAVPVHLLWRGPTWVNTNWFLYRGLRQHGYDEAADHIKTQTEHLVEQSGFREFYNPETGQGMGAEDFGWSTLVVDL